MKNISVSEKGKKKYPVTGQKQRKEDEKRIIQKYLREGCYTGKCKNIHMGRKFCSYLTRKTSKDYSQKQPAHRYVLQT